MLALWKQSKASSRVAVGGTANRVDATFRSTQDNMYTCRRTENRNNKESSSSCGKLSGMSDHIFPETSVLCFLDKFDHLPSSLPLCQTIQHFLPLSPSASNTNIFSCHNLLQVLSSHNLTKQWQLPSPEVGNPALVNWQYLVIGRLAVQFWGLQNKELETRQNSRSKIEDRTKTEHRTEVWFYWIKEASL